MADKLEQLVLRLEKAVQALEVGGSNGNSGQQQSKPAQKQKSSNLPSLLEFDHLITEFENQAAKLNLPEITEITKIVTQSVALMKQVMYYSEEGKKLDPTGVKSAQGLFKEHLGKLTPHLKGKTFDLHAKTMSDACSTFFWVFVDAPDMAMQGTIESAEFNGLKLRKAYPTHADWMVSLFNALKALREYAKENFKMGLQWNPKGTKTIADLENELKAIISGQQVPTQQAPQQQTPQQQAPQQQAPQQQAPQQQAPQQQAKKPEQKPPSKTQKQDNIYADNYTSGVVQFTEEECNLKTCILIEKCSNTTFNIQGKVKLIQFSNCQKCYLTCQKGVVASVECMNSKSLELFLLQNTPQVVVDKCDSVHVVLPKEPQGTDIITSMSQTVNVTYLLNDDFDTAKDQFIPQQLKTNYDVEKKRFVTQAYDMFI